MKDMNGYYDFSGQKFGYPLSLSINGFSQNVFTRQSSLELSYVLCGEYEAVTEQFSTIVHKEELILIAPYEMHLLRKRCGKDDGKILTIHIDFDRMPESMTGEVKGQFYSGVFNSQKNPSVYFPLKRKIGELVKMLMDGQSNLLRLNVLMAELVCFSARENISLEELPLQSEYQENYLKAIKYIDEHFKEPLTLQDVADQLSFSLSYTSKLLKKYMGIPFSKYLSYVRVRASLEALLEGKEQIEQIALECGMPNGKAYTKTFRELYGILPSAYRRKFRQNLKYSKDEEGRVMQLDEEQKSLLFHLVEGNRQMVYEDAKLVIWKEQEKFCCQVKEMWRDVTVAANGKIEVFFEET